jgi:hypothetical protein
MQRARVLLLPVNDTPNVMGFLPAKVFEYLSVQRHILAVAPQGSDLGRVLDGSHTLVERHDEAAMAQAIKGLFNSDDVVADPPSRFERRVLTGQLAQVLSGMAERTGRKP